MVSTTNLTGQEEAWLSEAAGRLRIIQAEAAGATPQQRRECLTEEIARSLKSISPANRKHCLEALLARFPVGGYVPKSAPLPPPTPAAETFDQLLDRLLKAASELPEAKRALTAKRLAEAGLVGAGPTQSFDQLLERLLKSAGELPEAKRNEVSQRLSQAGLAWVDKEALVLEVADELRQGLGLPAGQQPRLKKVVQLCTILVAKFHGLDQLAVAAMKELAPRNSLVKRPQEFPSAAAQFLTGDAETVDPQLRVVIDLLSALLKAAVDSGRDFGRQYVERLSPAAIDDVVTGEGGGSIFGKNKKERCWDRYVLLSKEFETADLVNRRIRDCMAAFVERKVSGGH